MIGDACPFAITQISNDFACEFGELVTRRAGPDIACHSTAYHPKCVYMHDQFKHVGLDVFDYTDDLGEVPHGIWLKIQYGGLLGLQKELEPNNDQDIITNIVDLVVSAEKAFENIEQLPYQHFTASMQSYRTKRRRIKQ